MTSSAESIKLTWLENPSIPIRPSYPVIQETAHFSGANQVTTTTNSHNSQKYGDLFEKLVSLIKAGTRKATASIQKHLGEDEDGILITYQESKDGQTLLHKTAIEANPDILGVLLDAGVDPDKLDFRGRSPLHLIVESGKTFKKC
ncbi:NF-kappa-B inhibitor alpha [Folsomia candida]|uniref:NF-kappa-B inhibitor alpha n=1 Tax=Folsomia candida TaxID=158441 RepID=A0A226DZB9_FOLCA|nr:NF-kappa-B inhibitor alpha [Folsomia candida]